MEPQLQISFEEPRIAERLKPRGSLINKLCGGDVELLRDFHDGLVETPLRAIYPSLNFMELAAFEPASRRIREYRPGEFLEFVKNASLYEIFKRVNADGIVPSPFRNVYQWINDRKKFDEELRREYNGLNPFDGKSFRERLEAVASEAPGFVEALKEALQEKPKSYVDERDYGEYYGDKAASGIVLRGWLPVDGVKQPQLASIYAKRIAQKLAGYPTEYSVPDKP